jgi:hypothetical protein
VLGAVLGLIGVLILGGWLTAAYDVTDLVPSIALQRTHDPLHLLTAGVLFLLFSAVALGTLKVTPGKRSERFEADLLETAESFAFVGADADLMGKEWIDLVRSRTLVPVVSAYIGPMAIMAVLLWFLGQVLTLSLDLNMVFYAALIGFFSVSIYSWLNLLDNNAFLDVLPIIMAQVIRTKLLMLSMIALLTSTVFLSLLGLLLGDLGTLPLGLLVAYVTTAYTVTATAYLTGLRTNSYLFDPRVLGRFSGLIVPPLCALVVLSLSYSSGPMVAVSMILLVCGAMAVATLAMYRRIGKRWDRATFGF